MRVLHVVGARPNFMKAHAVVAALEAYDGVQQLLVHTGQHYSSSMSEVFFQQLGLMRPHVNLEVGSGSHSEQTARIMLRFAEIAGQQSPDLVLVYGDVNSTVAAALVCAKAGIPLGHVEAGLRSFDRSMPEEINRVVTDRISDLLFTPSADADVNLRNEGIEAERIHLVGNVMIDTLLRLLPSCSASQTFSRLGLSGSYSLVTLHRPSNVDDPARLASILEGLDRISRHIQVVFPVHPRTQSRLDAARTGREHSSLRRLPPLGYLDFLTLLQKASLVITDSGGVQEETTFLGIPCLTLRDNTERPVTVESGTNTLIGSDMEKLLTEALKILKADQAAEHTVPPLWDGKSGQRIAEIVAGSIR